MNCQDRQASPRLGIACGLVIGWLATMFSPMGTMVDLADTSLELARLSFFIALAVTAAVACVPQLAGFMSRRTTAFSAAALCCVFGCINWALAYFGHASSVLLVCTFVPSGIVAVVLQIVLASLLSKGDASIRGVLGAIALGICIYAALALIPSAACKLLGSFISLVALAFMLPNCAPSTNALATNVPLSQSAAVASVMAAACVFNGTAEVASFITPAAMICGVSLGIAGGAVTVFALRHAHARRHHIMTVCALVIALGTLAQGLMAIGDSGQDLLNRGFGSLFHILAFAAEYILLALVLMRPPASGGAKRPGGMLLCWANAGIALGTILGMFVHDGAAATMFSLFVALVGVFLLGMQVGYDKAPATCLSDAPDARSVSLGALANEGGLSQRELDVLALWATGHQVDYVADQLCISKNTVKTHVRHIYTKLGVTNREELIQLIEQAG